MEAPTHITPQVEEVVARYQPSPQTIEIIRQTPLIFTVGISGAGKDSIQQKLFQTGKYQKLVAYTTRALRRNEQNGVDYHFISFADAWNMLQRGEYVEANIYSGNIYGTSAAEIARIHAEYAIGLGDIEVNGVAKYVGWSQTVKAIFVVPPDFATWQQRFAQRYANDTLSPEDFAARMRTAEAEIKKALAVEYFYFVVNDDLDTAAAQVDEIAQSPNSKPQAYAEGRSVAEKLLAELQQHLVEGV